MHFLFSIFDFIDNNYYIAGQGTMKQKRYHLGITWGYREFTGQTTYVLEHAALSGKYS